MIFVIYVRRYFDRSERSMMIYDQRSSPLESTFGIHFHSSLLNAGSFKREYFIEYGAHFLLNIDFLRGSVPKKQTIDLHTRASHNQ